MTTMALEPRDFQRWKSLAKALLVRDDDGVEGEMKMMATITKSSRSETVVTRNAGKLNEDGGVMASRQITSAGRRQGARVPGMFLVLCFHLLSVLFFFLLCFSFFSLC
ncbi:hypothetical protein MRB53_006279 [Persea americana]|uniref:Uncharacterized protein n=1 Tax=Persea americana TaxID=3435 RepID=A0ACC2MFI9_PERAE|nr:hypothetical protein MRB53_006279 [Persea americana]